jgi:hypothetical protein
MTFAPGRPGSAKGNSMNSKILIAALVLGTSTLSAAHAQTALSNDGDVTGSIGTSGTSVYAPNGHVRRPTEPGAFFNESDEQGHRNTGVSENPQMGGE